VVELAKGAGATFIARTTTAHPNKWESIERRHHAQVFHRISVDSMSDLYSRKNKRGMLPILKYLKKNTTPIGSKAKEEHPDLIELVSSVQRDKPKIAIISTIVDKAMQ
jgi:2-oxoglutarate ferredoxin oxidoreductase subunit beta